MIRQHDSSMFQSAAQHRQGGRRRGTQRSKPVCRRNIIISIISNISIMSIISNISMIMIMSIIIIIIIITIIVINCCYYCNYYH